jgi:hypothetical protein
MREKMEAKSSTKTGKARGKVADLAPKTLKGGAFNAFVNFRDIKGESTDKDHKD